MTTDYQRFQQGINPKRSINIRVRVQGALNGRKLGSDEVMKFGEAASMQLVFSPSKLLNFLLGAGCAPGHQPVSAPRPSSSLR